MKPPPGSSVSSSARSWDLVDDCETESNWARAVAKTSSHIVEVDCFEGNL